MPTLTSHPGSSGSPGGSNRCITPPAGDTQDMNPVASMYNTSTGNNIPSTSYESLAIPCLAIDPNPSAYFGRGIYDKKQLHKCRVTHELIQSVRHLPSREHLSNPERIKKIQSAVGIGSECSDLQCQHVLDLLAEFADTFTITLSKVRLNKRVEHGIKVPPDAKLL